MRKTIFALTSVVGLAFSASTLAAAPDANKVRSQAKGFFQPLAEQMPGAKNDTAEKIALGEKLYFETALSVNGTQSCNTCHRLDEKLGGVDNKKFSDGALEGTIGDRNSPTVWNAGFHFVQFWDGRAADLKEQAKGPILNPVEMGIPDEATAVKNIKDAGYSAEFEKVFGTKNAVTYDNIAEAIAAFERTLITKDRFDDFLKGDNEALSSDELTGLQDFMASGCIVCHTGPLLGGHMYQKMGMVQPYPDTKDTGRHQVTGKETDKFMFKVPSLRNISKTAPYFHDGAAETLEEAVYDMGWYQLGRKLDDKTVASITTFLKSLDNQREFKRTTK